MEAHPTPLIDYWLQQPPETQNHLCEEQGLYGPLDRYGLYTNTHALRQIQHRNLLFMIEFENINKVVLQQTQTVLTPLKGLSLLKEIYKLHERPLTDMDVYTPLSEEVFTPILQDLGYHLQNEIRWAYNRHKFVFIKKTNLIDFTLEVHTELVVRTTKWIPAVSPEGRLLPTDEFLFLSYHWAEQHTCLKLFWLFDLYLFWKKHAPELRELQEKARALQLSPSLEAVHWALKHAFQVDLLSSDPPSWRSFFIKRLLTTENLFWLHRKPHIYLPLKQLLRPNLREILKYNVLWLWTHLRKTWSVQK